MLFVIDLQCITTRNIKSGCALNKRFRPKNQVKMVDILAYQEFIFASDNYKQQIKAKTMTAWENEDYGYPYLDFSQKLHRKSCIFQRTDGTD